MELTDAFGGDIAAKLTSARIAAGLSIRDAANRLPDKHTVSHVTLSKYEKGIGRPSLETLCDLAQLYGRSPQWFLEQTLPLTGVQYRHYKSKVTAGQKRQYEAEAQKWLEAYLRIERRLGEELRREVKCPPRSAGASPQEYAATVRKSLGIGADEPVESVVGAMQRCGIRVIELEGPEGIDGFAAHIGTEPVVVLNPRCSNERMRLSESHELFHGLLGHCGEAGSGGDEVEDDAFACGRSFLLPSSQLKEAFKRQSFVDLVRFKERFGISLGAMIYAAEQEKIISSGMTRRLWIELSKRGWRVKEPGHVRADRATRFESLLDGAVNRGKIDWREAASIVAIPVEQLQQRVRIAMGIDEGDIPTPEKGDDPTFKGLRLAK